jgi:predicted Zn-dependent peptidase
MLFRLPVDGTPELDAGSLALDVLAGGQSSRLNRRLVRDEQIAQSVSGGALPLIGGVSFGTLTGIAVEGVDLQRVEDAIAEEVEKLAEGGITADELEAAKGHLKGSIALSLESSASRMHRIGSSELTLGEVPTLDDVVARVEAVGAEDVARVIDRVLGRADRTLAVVGPFEESDFQERVA